MLSLDSIRPGLIFTTSPQFSEGAATICGLSLRQQGGKGRRHERAIHHIRRLHSLPGDCENRVSIVKVFELPDELPDSVVIGRLSHYRRVISFRQDRVADTIFNGVRTAKMFIERPIPTQTFIASEFCRFWCPTQPKTCKKCGAEDHLTAVCKTQRCFNCEQPGHRVEHCDMLALCRVCLSDSHETTSCPYI